ncbi:MAG: M48 family metallopeptidase [Acidimicrobiales bacterium]
MKPEPIHIPGQLSFDDPALISAPPATVAETAPHPELVEMVADLDDGVPPLTVSVIRSVRRRKTAQARLVGTTVEVRIPARCSSAEERELVAHFRAKFERARRADAIDLRCRARDLAIAHGLPEPTSIRWVTNQQHRWGSCTPTDRTIRLSNRLVGFPPWVVDYVIVHELAHLVVPRHDAEFWAVVGRYPLTERARGFLMAKGWDPD